MNDAAIQKALRLLAFMENTDAFTSTLRNYQWALREVLRLRAILASLQEA